MAQRLNITIDQGSTYSLSFDVNDANNDPMDLSSHTVAAQLRKHYASNSAVTFATSVANTNQITLDLTSTQTANIVAGKYVYDVEIDDGANTVTRVLQGTVSVTPEVTKI